MEIFKKDYIIGLDIGSSSVKMAQFAKTEGGLRLLKADLKQIKRIDGTSVSEGEIVQTLKDLFKGIDVKKSEILVSINCPQTAIKKATVPYMPKAELREGISLEAKNYFPFPVDNSLVDFEILGDVVEKGVRKYEIAIAVSPRKTINMYLALLEKTGIRPASLVPCVSVLQSLSDLKEGRTSCILDMGQKYSELAIFNGKNLVFNRKIPVSGDDLTNTMTGALVSDRGTTKLTVDEAETVKRKKGIPTETGSEIIDGKISTTQIFSMLRTPLEQLVNEIERCFDYYREESGGGRIDSLMLFGGGAALRGLAKYLSEGLSIEVKLGDPLESLKMEKDAVHEREKTSYRLELAVGAALSGGGGINLLPPEIKEETKRIVKRGTIEAVVTAVILVLILVFIGMKIQLGNFQKRILVADRELSGLQPQLKKAEAQHLANMVLADEPHWEDVFKELSNLMPNGIQLTTLKLEKNIITMEGIVTSQDGEGLLSDFILTLEKGMFKDIKLVKIKDLEEKTGNEFKLTCWIDEEKGK